MTAVQLLTVAKAAGIVLEARGDRLLVDAPVGALTLALRDQLAQQKPALLVLLGPPQTFVTLKNGPTVPAAAIALALDLEARGIALATDPDHQFIVPTDPQLTPIDCAAITRWRQHLGVIVEYRAPEVG